jgi:selT/selW/selH-like putative selenoprotein
VTDSKHQAVIEFCVSSDHLDEAVTLATEILGRWAPIMREVELRCGTGGRFEVSLDGDLSFSKAALKRLPEPGEVTSILEKKLGRAAGR